MLDKLSQSESDLHSSDMESEIGSEVDGSDIDFECVIELRESDSESADIGSEHLSEIELCSDSVSELARRCADRGLEARSVRFGVDRRARS